MPDFAFSRCFQGRQSQVNFARRRFVIALHSPDLYKGMSRTFFSLRRRRGFGPRHPALSPEKTPSGAVPLGYSISAAASSLVATTPISFETNQAVRLYGVNHGSI